MSSAKIGRKERRAISGISCLYGGMNVQVAVLCDAATQDSNSKLNLLGAFDTILTAQLPAVQPCAVALRATFTADDEGPHKLGLNFINADGQSIMPPIEIPLMIRLPEDTHFLSLNFPISIQQLQFPAAGLYSVDIRLDGKSQAGIPLQVKLVTRPAV